MYAIIATGGKQYKVAEGDIIKVEKLGARRRRDRIHLTRCLQLTTDEVYIGCPTVAGATVTGNRC